MIDEPDNAILIKVVQFGCIILMLLNILTCDFEYIENEDCYYEITAVNVSSCEGQDVEEECDFDVRGNRVTIIHKGAVYNCCHDQIKISSESYGNRIRIFETEICPNPCFCECPYTITIRLKFYESGCYRISLYNDNNRLIRKADIIIHF